MGYEEWLDSDDGWVAKENFSDNAGDYESTEYDTYLKDKYEEYKVFKLRSNL